MGAQVAQAPAAAGGHVVLARNTDKAAVVAVRIGANAEVRALDRADLASVRAFAEGIKQADGLIDNAGVPALPLRRTVGGFEMQFGVHYFGMTAPARS